MKILFINELCGHTSTGKICVELAEKYEAENNEVKIAYGRDNYVPEKYKKYAVRIGTDYDVYIHALYTRITDKHGLGSKRTTKKFLRWADEFDPELLWLHNLHGYYINYELLFEWIKSRPNMKVKWTLHDCWAFTGHCSHFTFVGCEMWKTHCGKCPQKKEYPASLLIDSSYLNYDNKKKAFCGVNDMEIIVPSHWLEGLVKESFLKDYPIKVIHNTIDTSVFRPTPSDFREKYNLKNKKIVLGVANVWDERKGLDDYIRLSQILDDEYVVLLVGLNKRQIKELPNNIIGIQRTNNQFVLAGIYSTADYFINFTYEDNYPTVNLEAEACGAKVITYDTGGAGETIRCDSSIVIPQGDIAGVVKGIEILSVR